MSIDLKEFLASHPAPAGMTDATWATLAAVMSKSSLFDARVERTKLYDRLIEMAGEVMTNAKKTLPDGRTVSKTQGKSDWVRKAREFMQAEGIIGPEAVGMAYHNDVKRTGSMARLNLVFEVAMRSALAKGAWEKAMSPDEMEASPAYRFVRFPGAKIKRKVHEENENVVRLKTDFKFWAEEMNAKDLGGFEVPWGPFGFNSYMYQQPVSRAECEKIGLLKPGQELPAMKYAELYGTDVETRYGARKRASVKDVAPGLVERLKKQLEGLARMDEDKMLFNAEEAARLAHAETLALMQGVSKVSEKVNLENVRNAKVRDGVEHARQVIDLVHGDGPLPIAEVHNTKKQSQRGAFYPVAAEPRIDVSSTADMQSSAFIHEMGHFLDTWGLGKGRADDLSDLANKLGSYINDDMKDLMDTIYASHEMRNLEHLNISGQYKNYLASRHEAFARAYTQFIAEQSGDQQLLAELAEKRINPIWAGNQWSTEDFRPIREAFIKLFKKLGWIRKTT